MKIDGNHLNYSSKSGDVMSAIIKEAIELEEREFLDYSKYQKSRLEYLSLLGEMSIQEQIQERKRIIEKLKAIGIIDKNGELSDFYKMDEE